MPTPPSPIASPGTSSFGSTRLAPACFNRDDSRWAPTRSSSAIAGTFSDNCSAFRTGTVPWKLMSKFSGA